MPAATTIASGLTQLAAEVHGDGIPVAFLHAGVADRRMWSDQLALLAQSPGRYRAIAYDRRGFGESLHADERFSHVDDLLAVLDAQTGGVPAILVGCSQGGRIALDAALAHPARVRALMLVAPAVSGAPKVESFPPAIARWIESVEQAEAAADVDRLNALEAHAWLDGPLAAEGRVSGSAREMFLEMNELALRAEQRGVEIEPAPAYPRVDEIAVPTFVVWGDLDFPHVAVNCAHLGARIPGARTHVLRAAAHLPNLENPAQFNRLLDEFLASVTHQASMQRNVDRP